MSSTVIDTYEVVSRAADQVGESPVWDRDRGELFWVDIWGKRVSSVAGDGAVKSWRMKSEVGFITATVDSGFYVGLRDGVYYWSPDAQPEEVSIPRDEASENRFNDGKADRQGRLWAGTMSTVSRVPTGRLFTMDAMSRLIPIETMLVLPNTLAWSPDGDIMYFSDSWYGEVRAYSYDVETGERMERRSFIPEDSSNGDPDGACVDADGCVWIARFRRGAVFRYTPSGQLDRVVELPVRQVTSCAFGGPGLDTLFITSATARMSPEQLANEPLAGALFAADVGVCGLLETPTSRGTRQKNPPNC